MERASGNLKWLKMLAYASSAINLLLAVNFFPVIPLLSWLNYGHGGTSWLPDVLLLVILPRGYYLYWHFWFVIAIPAFAASLYLYKRTGNQNAKILTVLNAMTILVYWGVRIALSIMGIHPDSV
jgi:hypothetical protein